jgi:hypothetical protein
MNRKNFLYNEGNENYERMLWTIILHNLAKTKLKADTYDEVDIQLRSTLFVLFVINGKLKVLTNTYY